MNGEVNASVKQGVLKFFGEHALPADERERSGFHFIAGRLDDFNVNGKMRVKACEMFAYPMRLSEGESRAARADN